MEERTIHKQIFVSSTMDGMFEKERQCVQDVVNEIMSERYNVTIKVILCEKDSNKCTTSSRTYQDNINKDLDESDIVCFLFCNRIGTNTESEINRTIERGKERIVFLKAYYPDYFAMSVEERDIALRHYNHLREKLDAVFPGLANLDTPKGTPYTTIDEFKILFKRAINIAIDSDIHLFNDKQKSLIDKLRSENEKLKVRVEAAEKALQLIGGNSEKFTLQNTGNSNRYRQIDAVSMMGQKKYSTREQTQQYLFTTTTTISNSD